MTTISIIAVSCFFVILNNKTARSAAGAAFLLCLSPNLLRRMAKKADEKGKTGFAELYLHVASLKERS
jgi:hypothetical protein